MHLVKELVLFGLGGAFLMWVLEWLIADGVAKGIAKSRVDVDVQNQIEEGVRDALETYFRKRSIEDEE